MTRIRRRREVFWQDQQQQRLDYRMHPGAVLAQHTAWVKTTGEFSTMLGPEPDVVNVAIMHTKPVELELDHVYYVKHRSTAPLWVSFGYSADPQATVAAVKEPWIAKWINPHAQPLREFNFHSPRNVTYACDLPKTDRWRYCLSDDIADYTDK